MLHGTIYYCVNHMSYSSDKMGSSSKPFDVYEGPESDLEMMKPLATKANNSLVGDNTLVPEFLETLECGEEDSIV